MRITGRARIRDTITQTVDLKPLKGFCIEFDDEASMPQDKPASIYIDKANAVRYLEAHGYHAVDADRFFRPEP